MFKYTDPTGHFRIGGESFSGGPLGGFGEGFTGGFAGGGSGILQAFGSGLSLIFDMFSYNAWNEEVVADGSGDSQYYYEYEDSIPPGGILGGVVATPLHFEYGDDESWFSLDTAPSEIELTMVLGILGYVFAPQLQEMLDAKFWGYAHLAGMFVGGGTKVAASWGLKAVGRVFWSGNGNPAVMKTAMNFAKINNMKTLEMTFNGQIMNRINPILPRSLSGKIWNTLSKNFARDTLGDAHFFTTILGPRSSSIWSSVERPILEKNGVQIINHIF